jgi:hypothetical protein
VELHHFDAAPAPTSGNNFDAALAPALLYTSSYPTFLKQTKVNLRGTYSSDYCMVEMIILYCTVHLNRHS